MQKYIGLTSAHPGSADLDSFPYFFGLDHYEMDVKMR
jgi:hypothetical protein